MSRFEKIWYRANRLWRKYVTIPVKQLFCRHTYTAYHHKALEYDSNPPHQRYRWGIVESKVCVRCGKRLSKVSIVRDGMSRKEVGNVMRKLQRQQIRDFC